MAFSASEAAFEGFRLARRSPMTILIWAVLYIVMTVAILALAGGSLAAFMEQAQALETGGEPTPEQMAEFLGAYAAFMGAVGPISIVMSGVIYAAVNRAVFRPEEGAFGYLRLGMDELRVVVVYFALSILAAIFFGLLVAVGAVVVGVAASAMGDSGWLLVIPAILAFIAVMTWVLVRFSLAIPITVAEKKFAIFESWSATKGHFWGLLGMGLLAFVLTIVVQMLLTMVFMPIFFFGMGGFDNLEAISSMAPMEVFQTMLPLGISVLVYLGVLSALQLAIMYAPFAAAYRDIRGGQVSA
ncbi:hypothetical protein [Brevundimonas sp.]|uniref:hypothetical protein n=1 Tax=Brevundimonas sp. TaxID=1871086 RepID=UPI0025F6DCCD|nr:hypothetical protein [Brevundimonas sp.]